MNRSSGNILFLILIAVALFAALSYAVTSSSKGGGGVDQEAAKLNAGQVMQHASNIEQAITRLMLLNGCTPTQISMDSPIVPTIYVNPSAPADKRCHIFDTNGGGVSRIEVPGTFTGSSWQTDYSFYSNQNIAGAGSDEADLTLYAPVSLETCKAIQKKLGLSGIVTKTWSGSYFVGTYPPAPATVNNNYARQYCFQFSSLYYYRHVILAR